MKISIFIRTVILMAMVWNIRLALADVFHMPSEQTSLELVPVGDPGNQGDTQVMLDGTSGYGAVGYAYAIGKFEVSTGQYTQFLNAVAADDTHGLYETSMWTDFYGCKIRRLGSSGSYTYDVAADWANRPVNDVSWGDAARFCNWLHNGQPTGAQTASTTENGAYRLLGAMTDFQLAAVGRHNANAKFWLPTENEWYKAAYYKGESADAGYWLYPTQSDSVPGKDISEQTNHGNNANSNTWENPIDSHRMTEVGEFELSDSAYGTYDQGGNISEWNERVPWSGYRGMRGGSFGDEESNMSSPSAWGTGPSGYGSTIGFRIACIPEPSSLHLLIALFIAAGLGCGRQTAKRSGESSSK